MIGLDFGVLLLGSGHGSVVNPQSDIGDCSSRQRVCYEIVCPLYVSYVGGKLGNIGDLTLLAI